jgi:serine/threonine-protein kinase HipA
MTERQVVEVCADWAGLGGPRRMGLLSATPARGKELFSFEYDRAWLESKHALALDPALGLFGGPQYAAGTRGNFGVFLDSAPDRWGRTLLDRREAHLARGARRRTRRLSELDYLLGVYDGHRLGGLRYRLPQGPFLDDNLELASPPLTSLRKLEQASLSLEKEGSERDPRFSHWLTMLVAPGRSLGGARPKASVVDARGDLWIAKFPSATDEEDIGAWERVLHALAERAGVAVAASKAFELSRKHHTFLSRRFDRGAKGTRLHFASAMTMLGKSDGDRASYLDLAAVLSRQGAQAGADLEQLWRRIVFSVLTSNVDDHLRNHGFLLESRGWVLAPAYDLNPVAHGNGLTLDISETDNAQDLSLVRDVAPNFRVPGPRAERVIAQVLKAVRGWGAEATRVGISRAQRDRMAPAFRLATG